MNKTFWIGAIFVATTFLLTNTLSSSNAYGCTNSTSTNHTSSDVKGTSANTSTTKPSASTSSSQISTVAASFGTAVTGGTGIYVSPCHSAGDGGGGSSALHSAK